MTMLSEHFGVCRFSYKHWRNRRRVIDSDKVKLQAFFIEKEG